MGDFSPVAADFFRYLVIGLTFDMTMSAMFRSAVFFTPNTTLAEVRMCACVREAISHAFLASSGFSKLNLCSFLSITSTAQILAPVYGVFCLLFGGFFLTRKHIDPWFIWIYYLSPFSWTLRAFGIIEFSSNRYADSLIAHLIPSVRCNEARLVV